MAAAKRTTNGQDCIYSSVNRTTARGQAGTRKLPLAPLDNLTNQWDGPSNMSQRRTTFDPHSGENTLSVGHKLPRTHRANIKEKISQWEGKESPQTAPTPATSGPPSGVKRAESPTKPNSKLSEDPRAEEGRRITCKEEKKLRKENIGKLGDSRPGSPIEAVRQHAGRLLDGGSKCVNESQTREDCREVTRKEKQNVGKENVGALRDSRPASPLEVSKQQLGMLRRSNDSNMKEDSTREKRAVFTLFRKLEQAMGSHGKTPSELGNYFSPPSRDKQEDAKTKESESMIGFRDALKSFGTSEDRESENVYTEPGAPPINPVPKPQRTFQHPNAPASRSQRQRRSRRSLPPLPSISPPTSLSRPLPGNYRRPRADRLRNTVNRFNSPVAAITPSSPPCVSETPLKFVLTHVQKSRKSFEFEDLLEHHSPSDSLPLSQNLSQEHHYEDIPDSSKENPYEDIEVDSQCSQQSVPSSPGADINKMSRPGFFRQNSGRSFKLLDLRRTHHRTNSAGSGGVSSPPQLSPPSTPTCPDHMTWLPGDPLYRTYRRIPTVVLKINSIFEARTGKKRLRRVYHYVETSSGRVTDENSDSESEVEDRARAHQQRLVSVQSILSQPSQAQTRSDSTNSRNSSVKKGSKQDLHQRQLFEYFLVVSLQRGKAGAPYLPEVTQQFPVKLERSFKFMRETEDQLRIIPQFCFPDSKDWEPVEKHPSEMFSFVLTGEDGSRRFGYCRRLLPSGKGKRLPEVYCIVSHLGCFNLFSKVLDEVERRRALSPALVQPFMRAIMEAQFPAPGRTITIKTFLPGTGTEVMELCRPPDSRLEHVDFECLFSCLSLRLLFRVLGSLLLERRVIFTADKLSTLSQCCHAVVALLYPFAWQHTYIPVLPSAMLDIVCTPTPFIVGLLSSSLPQLTDLPLEEVLVVDLGKSRLLRQLDDEDTILPPKLQSALENVLERRRDLANERGGDSPNDSVHLSTVVSEAFVRFFLELVGHYPLFIISEREDGYSSSSSSPVPCSFQHQSFRKSVQSKSVRRFLEVFMETQMFGWFIQERELHKQAFRGLFEVRVQEYLESIQDNEHHRVNRFLKGLGNKMKFLSKK